MKEENVIMLIAVVALLMSLVAAGITYFSVSSLMSQFTGLATATTNLTVESMAVINFTTNIINWGSGSVNVTGGCSKAYLDTLTGTVTCGNWTAVNSPLVIQNDGNVNLTLNISGTKTAAQMFGGTNPAYKWNVSNLEDGSCLNSTGGTGNLNLGVYGDVNTTTTTWCGRFQFIDSADTVRIHFNLTVPSDSMTGALGDVITATGYT